MNDPRCQQCGSVLRPDQSGDMACQSCGWSEDAARVRDLVRPPKLDADGRIVGGTYHGMTPREVIEQRDRFRRACGE